MCVNELLVQVVVRSNLGCQPEYLVDTNTELCFAVVVFLGEFLKLRKAAMNFISSFFPSARLPDGFL